MPRGRPRKIPNPPPAVPKAPEEPNLQRFDPWNSSSTGHQRAETRGPQGWRRTRFKKMNYQFKGGNGGGEEFMSDTVGHGSKEYDEKLGVYIPKEVRELATGQRKSVLEMLRNPSNKRKADEEHEKREVTLPIPTQPPAIEPPHEQEEGGDGLTAEEREIFARLEAEEQEAQLQLLKQKLIPTTEEYGYEGEDGLTPEERAAFVQLAQQEQETTHAPKFFTPLELDDEEEIAEPEHKTTQKPRFFASPRAERNNVSSSTATYYPPPILSPPTKPQPRDSPTKPPSEQASPNKGVFDNLVIYINGSTYPVISDHKLKHLLASNGASVALHVAKKQVTHVILGKSNFAGGGLAAQKLQKEIKTIRGRGVKFVSVDWVMESVKAGKRQPEGRFVEATVNERQGGSGGGLFAKAQNYTSTQ
ncbi:hypothetical protein QBC36DRAFT_240814 [Triangularia setosa]|uniref:BRCT domain-containing protein n=1 Tax=Triangularia setosa TaxID=2587417 RepID=A0AAN6W566_9PEZI|nr:hypothetical protein QBC36DRAFT_240814 [Podospora setosa]